jgi:L-aspartate oxidase
MEQAVRAADVIVVGAGAAGLCTALHLPAGTDVCVVEKAGRGQGSSPWAQGGVAAAFGPEDSPALHARDTLDVAGGHADPLAVEALCEEAPAAVLELVELGCPLDRTPEGGLDLAREGGQTVPRSAHAGDATGAAIMDTLRRQADRRFESMGAGGASGPATRVEGRCLGLRMAEGRCCGVWVWTAEGIVGISAPTTVLATGGLGGLFASTTNPTGATGSGPALAWEAGAAVADLEFVQFHPTVLAAEPVPGAAGSSGDPGRLLLTEALRGAGAHVVDRHGRRFLFDHHPAGELAPRDVVARAVAGTPAWLDCRHLGPRLAQEFGVVTAGCRAAGLDPERDLLPIAPAAHYAIGGIRVDLDGRASVPGLFAVGECACTGVHGANRLAGNSLAEALVFGRRAARAIASSPPERPPTHAVPPVVAAGRRDTEGTAAGWRELRAACSAGLGIERDAAGLKALDRAVQPLAEEPLPADPDRATLRAAAICARLMAQAALLRTESRGAHRRADHPAPDPAWAGARLSLTRLGLP